ncbi:MAG: glycosyltransferase family 2 protein [Dorea sp.]
MVNGLISIILPVYNAEKYLKETIQSVLNQTYINYEIIAVNDGSKDSSFEILQQFTDHRIQIINKENTGVSDTST